MRLGLLTIVLALGACSQGGPDERPAAAPEARLVDGRWATHRELCQAGPGMVEGQLSVSRQELHVDRDICAIVEAEPLGSASWRFYVQCNAGDGADYARDFEVSVPREGTLRWNDQAAGRVVDYVRCDGGANQE